RPARARGARPRPCRGPVRTGPGRPRGAPRHRARRAAAAAPGRRARHGARGGPGRRRAPGDRGDRRLPRGDHRAGPRRPRPHGPRRPERAGRRGRIAGVTDAARLLPVTDPATWGPALDEAVHTLSRGGLVVLPTDTVYGVAADAFDHAAVSALLAVKGRGRQMPPPVLVPGARTLDGLATEVPDGVRDLVAT